MTTTATRKSSSSAVVALVVAVIAACCVARACASAIPMWEFLTREEKMNHLYRIFSQEVSQHCRDSSSPDCSKNLLVTGLRNLANLDDDKLDEMDPYQRGAKDIIWRAMVGNNRQQGSRLGQHSFHATEDDPLAVGDNELPQESIANHDYAHPQDLHAGPYLMGPMVVRVYPDGRPVPNDAQRPLPKDEDIEDIRYTGRLPSLKELEKRASSSSTSTGKPSYLSAQASVPTREMLPPPAAAARKSISRASFFRYPGPARYYPARPNLIRSESFY